MRGRRPTHRSVTRPSSLANPARKGGFGSKNAFRSSDKPFLAPKPSNWAVGETKNESFSRLLLSPPSVEAPPSGISRHGGAHEHLDPAEAAAEHRGEQRSRSGGGPPTRPRLRVQPAATAADHPAARTGGCRHREA